VQSLLRKWSSVTVSKQEEQVRADMVLELAHIRKHIKVIAILHSDSGLSESMKSKIDVIGFKAKLLQYKISYQ
jgi:hypothetical protein